MAIDTGGFIKVIAGGRITLPKEFKSMWNLSEGDLLAYEMIDQGLLLKPLDVTERKMDKLKKLSEEEGAVAPSGQSAKEILKGEYEK